MYCFIFHSLVLIPFRSEAAFAKERLTDILPGSYNKYEPPMENGKPTNVYLQLDVIDVDTINDGAMEFGIQSYVYEIWRDDRLNLSIFQLDEEGKMSTLPAFLSEHIWTPDLVFDNTRKEMLFHLSLPNTVITVLNDGTLMRCSRYNLVVGCRMNFLLYPMDTQECYLKIKTMSNPNSKVLLRWAEEYPKMKMKSILIVYNIEPLMFYIQETKPYNSTDIKDSVAHTSLYANMTFVRRLSGSLFNVYVPSSLVVFLSWISFWLDVEAVPARVTLGVTSLLTLATQIVRAHSMLPPISYMTAMDVWLFVCLLSIFSSLLEFSFAHQMLNLKKEEYSGFNNFTADGEIKKFAFTSRLKKVPSSRNSRLFYKKEPDCNAEGFEKLLLKIQIKSAKDIDKVSRKLFPFTFLTFAAVYWTYYLSIK